MEKGHLIGGANYYAGDITEWTFEQKELAFENCSTKTALQLMCAAIVNCMRQNIDIVNYAQDNRLHSAPCAEIPLDLN